MSCLSPKAITSGLETGFIGQRVIYQPRLASTMEVAKEEAQRGAPEGTVVIADEQTCGRGRLERIWLSPRGGVYLSIILYPQTDYLPSLIMVASVAAAHSITEVTGLESQLKWPNDVLIKGKKVGGILIESGIRGRGVNHAVVGMGINVNLKTADFAQILPTATSLADELGREVPRLKLVRSLLFEFERLYLSLPSEAVYQEWRDSLVTLGRKVHVRSGSSLYEGSAESVARDGSLVLRRPDGNPILIAAGDVTLSD